MTARWRSSPGLRDLRVLGEALVVIIATWLLLRWSPDRAITQEDGSQLIMPYLRGSLDAGVDWTHYLYRFSVLGGSEMHPFGGTMPIIQLCAAAGVSTTMTCNVVTWFVQLAIAYLAILVCESLATLWSGEPVRLGSPARVVAVWLCAFAPVVGWRLGVGHENLLLGLLPFLATFALLLAASANRLTTTSLLFTTFAVANGVSGLGAQSVTYGVIFGTPLAVTALLAAPRGLRWTRTRWQAIAALVAGVLLVLPRMIPMLAHASGDDATRGLGAETVYSYSTSSWSDWLASIPWTDDAGLAQHPHELLHEFNFPLGPIALFAALLWPRNASRKLLWAALASGFAAIVLADHIAPLSDALLAALPPLRAFRVPSRAILPVAVALPMLALAAWTAAAPRAQEPDRSASWIGVALAAGLVLAGGWIPAWVREGVAWAACIAVVIVIRRAPQLVARGVIVAALAPIAALGLLAFDERIPKNIPVDTIEHGPARIREAVVAQVPDATMPLVRIELPDPRGPFAVSTAWAAGLSTLDGLYYPPRRFLNLLSAFVGEELPPTTCNFTMTHFPWFAAYQQLYDVVAVVRVKRDSGSVDAPPPPVGPAWFPAELASIDDAREMVKALYDSNHELHAAVAKTGWILRADHAPVATEDAACARASVRSVLTDEDGQVATIAVDSPADCVLIVSTNYVSIFHATADGRDTAVMPIDVALTGIVVPRGATTVVLAPSVVVPTWSYVLAAIGALLLALAVVDVARRKPPVSHVG